MWKDIPGYEGRYQASIDGKVRSLLLEVPRILSPCLLKGYEAVSVKPAEGKRRLITVHRLVLMAFVGVCPEGKEARHKDGNNRNNNIENLEWATHLENMRDRFKHGTYVGHVFTKEECEKISASKRGKPRDSATREKLRIAQTGKKASPETRRKVTEALLRRWAKYRAEQSKNSSGA